MGSVVFWRNWTEKIGELRVWKGLGRVGRPGSRGFLPPCLLCAWCCQSFSCHGPQAGCGGFPCCCRTGMMGRVTWVLILPPPLTVCTARTGHTSPRTETSVSLVGHQRRWACGSPRQCTFWVQALGLWSVSAWVKIPVMFPLGPMTLSKASRSKLGNAHSPHLLLLRGL